MNTFNWSLKTSNFAAASAPQIHYLAERLQFRLQRRRARASRVAVLKICTNVRINLTERWRDWNISQKKHNREYTVLKMMRHRCVVKNNWKYTISSSKDGLLFVHKTVHSKYQLIYILNDCELYNSNPIIRPGWAKKMKKENQIHISHSSWNELHCQSKSPNYVQKCKIKKRKKSKRWKVWKAQNSVIFLCVSAFLCSLWMESSWAFCWASRRRAADSFSSRCFTMDVSLVKHKQNTDKEGKTSKAALLRVTTAQNLTPFYIFTRPHQSVDFILHEGTIIQRLSYWSVVVC